MSSNNNHITPLHLTRDNYEEAFLMYVDEELNAEQKAAVEAFVALHPDLQEELDILLSTKLPLTDDVPALDKSPLFADSMKGAPIEESLLLYIDNELPAGQAKAVEQKIKEDKDYSLQHQLLAKTKLDATETIVYPYKKELYRHTGRKVVYAQWWRVAAAAVVLLWAGTFYWSSNEDSAATSGPVALQTKTTSQTTPVTINNNKAAAVTDNEITTAPTDVEAIAVTAPAQKEKQTFTASTPSDASVANAVVETSVASMLPAAQRITDVQTSTDFIPETRQQIFNDAVVTSAEPVRTISTDAHTTTPVPVEDDVASAGQERGGSLKGFLRKTTRFIERTTSINPVNADNELLIGALAIKVK